LHLARDMSRDFRKLQVFHLADQLVLDVYRTTQLFPPAERYGLQAQLRRASVSTTCNIVEGSARESNKDYAPFLRIACGSATEARYLITVASRLKYLDPTVGRQLEDRFDRVVRSLEVLSQRVAAEPEKEKLLPATRSRPER
jgi:four helix bundle protein